MTTEERTETTSGARVPESLLLQGLLEVGTSTFIDATWTVGRGAAIACLDPSTDHVLGEPRGVDEQQLNLAVAAARRAFDEGAWRGATPAERASCLRRLASLMQAHRDELVDLVIAEVGSPLALARALQVDQPIKNFRWIADAAERGPLGGYVEELTDLQDATPSRSILRREPIGVVAAIVPYNYPINLVSWKVGPALAAGCTVVLLPSPQGALCALAMAKLFDEAGFPPGVINVVLGDIDISRQLVAHPDVDLVSFTGSSATGAAVMALAATTTKKVVLELGGKSPSVILPSADLARATGQTILRFARNAGQGCGSTTRVFVHVDQYDAFVAEAIKFLESSVPVGDPHDEANIVGPLISQAHLERVEGYLRRALAAGGQVIYGGARLATEHGAFLLPTLIGGLGNDAELCQEELFAPVGAVITYESVDEAVRLANESQYALNAAVWGDAEEAMEVALRLESGTVAINGGGGARSDVPWGGGKRSGRSAEMGEDGFREFFTVKHIQWPVAPEDRGDALAGSR